jgi:CPSF A subunit region
MGKLANSLSYIWTVNWRIRYEFATNEFVNAIECVTLETDSTEAGVKEYIAVGTTINRGEDLAAKGCVSPN